MKIFRHGDILLTPVDSIPDDVILRDNLIIARGELTGHAHRITTSDRAELFDHGTEMFLQISGGPASLVHEEHATITLQPGAYRIWRQREYNPRSYAEFIED